VGREPNTGVKVGNPRAGITLSEKMSRAATGLSRMTEQLEQKLLAPTSPLDFG